MHIYRNRVTDWFVAESPERARELCREHYDDWDESDIEAYGADLFTFALCPDDEPLKVADDDGEDARTKTCAEWAASEPPGLLCSTEY